MIILVITMRVCHHVVSFLIYALPGRAVYTLCPSYHLYSVLLYNLRCLMKTKQKWKKKEHKQALSRSDYVMRNFTWICKWFQKNSFWIVNESKWE